MTQTAWGIALATQGLCAYIGVAAFFSAAPGDRPGGAVFCVVAVLAAFAQGLVRRQRGALAKTFVAIGAAQVIAAAIMIAAHWGTVPVLIAINGILLAGWLLAAGLFYAAARPAGS